MSLFGNSPKCVRSAIENELLLNTYFPGWNICFYTPPYPEFIETNIDKIKIMGAEVVHPLQILLSMHGGICIFMIANDPTVNGINHEILFLEIINEIDSPLKNGYV